MSDLDNEYELLIDSTGDGEIDEIKQPSKAEKLIDSDNDGIFYIRDNCPYIGNPSQLDTDGKGIGDACESTAVLGDLDYDGDIDRDHVNIVMGHRNQPAEACTECDIDGDGTIRVLDARKVITMCTCPRCICR